MDREMTFSGSHAKRGNPNRYTDRSVPAENMMDPVVGRVSLPAGMMAARDSRPTKADFPPPEWAGNTSTRSYAPCPGGKAVVGRVSLPAGMMAARDSRPTKAGFRHEYGMRVRTPDIPFLSPLVGERPGLRGSADHHDLCSLSGKSVAGRRSIQLGAVPRNLCTSP
jgi:hypothetical protein